MMDPAVTAKMADTKALGEVKALEAFYAMLQTEPAKAFYGIKHVESANQSQAIETLLISDNLFRSVIVCLVFIYCSHLVLLESVIITIIRKSTHIKSIQL